MSGSPGLSVTRGAPVRAVLVKDLGKNVKAIQGKEYLGTSSRHNLGDLKRVS